MPFTLPQSLAVKLLLHTHLLNSSKCHTPPPGLMALFLLNCLGHILDLTILLDDGDTAGALGQRGQVTTQSVAVHSSSYSVGIALLVDT